MESDWYDEMEKAEQEYDAREYELDQEYKRGWDDAINKVKGYFEAQFLMQNNPNSKFVETIVCNRGIIKDLDLLKEGRINDSESM